MRPLFETILKYAGTGGDDAPLQFQVSVDYSNVRRLRSAASAAAASCPGRKWRS
jgi:hypothetical protein